MRTGILLCACMAAAAAAVGAAAQQQPANEFATGRPQPGAAAQGAAAAQPAAADDKPVVSGPLKFLPTPDKVDLLKQVTDPQLDGENRGRQGGRHTHTFFDRQLLCRQPTPSAEDTLRPLPLPPKLALLVNSQ